MGYTQTPLFFFDPPRRVFPQEPRVAGVGDRGKLCHPTYPALKAGGRSETKHRSILQGRSFEKRTESWGNGPGFRAI